MISTGHRYAASRAQQASSSGTSPSAWLPQNRYASTSSEHSSHGFWSKISGQVFQHAPQLTQEHLSIFTYIVLPEVWYCNYKNRGDWLQPGECMRSRLCGKGGQHLCMDFPSGNNSCGRKIVLFQTLLPCPYCYSCDVEDRFLLLLFDSSASPETSRPLDLLSTADGDFPPVSSRSSLSRESPRQRHGHYPDI